MDPLPRPPAGAFAAVMATGIVSVAAFEEQAQARALSTLSELLAWLAAGAYALLVLLIAADLARGAERLRRDLATPPASFESLTFAAASGVLSVRMLLADRRVVAAVLGLVAVAGWLGLGGVAWASLARRPSGRLARAARGSWLLAAVATQSLAVLAASAAQPGSDASPSAVSGGAWASLLLAAALGWWLAGMVLYGLLAVPIWDRLLAALRGAPWAWFDADDWITMGALAITALAGTQIVVAARVVPAARTILGGLGPAAAALAMPAWAAASGWILPLAALHLRCIAPAVVRRGRRRVARGRAPWWAAVFPLGMYAVASHALAAAFGLAALEALARVFVWIAVAAWLTTGLSVAVPWLAAGVS